MHSDARRVSFSLRSGAPTCPQGIPISESRSIRAEYSGFRLVRAGGPPVGGRRSIFAWILEGAFR